MKGEIHMNREEVLNTNFCKRCGKCCQAIMLPWPVEKFYYEHKKGGDPEFVWLNFEDITIEEAFEINPNLRKFYISTKSRYGDISLKQFQEIRGVYYYKCLQYKEGEGCMVHKDRPQLCSGYPFYNGDHLPIEKDHIFYSKDCGYNRPEFMDKTYDIYTTIDIKNVLKGLQKQTKITADA